MSSIIRLLLVVIDAASHPRLPGDEERLFRLFEHLRDADTGFASDGASAFILRFFRSSIQTTIQTTTRFHGR